MDEESHSAAQPRRHESEERRQASDGRSGWVEVWDQWFVVEGERRGGYVRLELRPHENRAIYWAALIGFDRPLVSVLVDDLPLPSGRLEIRGPGIWTETTVLEPFTHLTTDLEAFGVSIEPPTDVWSGAYGMRTAVGLEIDFDTAGPPGPSPRPELDGYRLVGRMHGEVLLDEQKWKVEALGVRDHWWGVPQQDALWRGWVGRDGSSVNSDHGRLVIDVDDILAGLPIGPVLDGIEVIGWAPALSDGTRHARALVCDDRGSGWFEIESPSA